MKKRIYRIYDEEWRKAITTIKKFYKKIGKRTRGDKKQNYRLKDLE